MPDTFTASEVNANFGTNDSGTVSDGAGSGAPFEIGTGGPSYRYKGPFRAIGASQWEISRCAVFFEAMTGTGTGIGLNYPAGVFQNSLAGSGDPNFGYGSFLFPRSGKMSINPEIDHFSSLTPFGNHTLETLVAAGDTAWMYGCNLRVTNYDAFSNEGIGL